MAGGLGSASAPALLWVCIVPGLLVLLHQVLAEPHTCEVNPSLFSLRSLSQSSRHVINHLTAPQSCPFSAQSLPLFRLQELQGTRGSLALKGVGEGTPEREKYATGQWPNSTYVAAVSGGPHTLFQSTSLW